jgi:uncharacterized protein (DUF1800 family)
MKRILVIVVAITASVVLGAAVPNDDQAIIHVLNRIGFGPRPGDVEKVRAIGLRRYIDEQLHPERLADASMNTRLRDLTTIGLSAREIAERYEQPVMEARRARKQTAKDAEPEPERQKGVDPIRQQANSVLVELAEQKLLRAVYSDRQLQEVLSDFWFNHFNVDARKNRDRFLLTAYERDAIRPRVLGTFRDLLEATARDPAMLVYLDNWMSASETAPGMRANTGARPFESLRVGPSNVEDRRLQPSVRRGLSPVPGAVERKKAPRGLNENYARELMELHTLGVDGGYTQKDVTEVARAFTGWTIENPRRGSGFRFEPRIHDPGAKVVLGHTIKAGGGESDGEQVLDILAAHPSTARFIATKLARRFVSDVPPPALVDRAAARFRETRGDLREVIRTILTSPEFLSPDTYYAKVKTPFEFVVSSLRATATDVQDAKSIVRELQQLGMPLYMCQPPTGYKDTADAWVNTGALVGRMNYALKLARNDKDLALTLGAPEFQKR